MEIECLNLAQLPMDIMQIILREEDIMMIDRLLMISPRWNTAVLMQQIDIHLLPVIELFRWQSNEKTVNFTIRCHEKYREFLGITSWQYRPVPSYNSGIIEATSPCLLKFFKTSEKQALARVFKLFNRCWIIKKLELSINVHSKEFDVVKSAMPYLHVYDLVIDTTDAVPHYSVRRISELLQIGQMGNIRHVFLSADLFCLGNEFHVDIFLETLGLFFSTAIQCVNTMEIRSKVFKCSEMEATRIYYEHVVSALQELPHVNAFLFVDHLGSGNNQIFVMCTNCK